MSEKINTTRAEKTPEQIKSEMKEMAKKTEAGIITDEEIKQTRSKALSHLKSALSAEGETKIATIQDELGQLKIIEKGLREKIDGKYGDVHSGVADMIMILKKLLRSEGYPVNYTERNPRS